MRDLLLLIVHDDIEGGGEQEFGRLNEMPSR